ncbi:LAMI_0C11166g1_1 [Lachancea mirantina]|uniref:LAMI_0C11166g1_1 n=1 Tax=Lachancea mirantina TaxID=1230905 RepID=A0A1G4J6F4_9SACH|nr:LAMI_0C11166g1_1 [Lachancea mirantina]
MEFSKSTASLLQFDKKHIWHPYTSMLSPMSVYPVRAAEGCYLILDTADENGTKVIDGMSSWWCAIHGYNHRELNEALMTQTRKVSHVMFGGLTHEPAITLVQKLLEFVDHEELQHCFLADSGSVAVEVAMKMALQYNFTLGNQSKRKFLTVRYGYHGDTTGPMSVCDPVGSMHSIYTGYLAENVFAEGPPTIPTLPTSQVFQRYPQAFRGKVSSNKSDISDFQAKIESLHEELCAVILEPILQGAGGMRLYHPQFLIDVRKLCNKYHVPLIMDEIATGFGRTGALFAYQHCKTYQDLCKIPAALQVDVYPDIMCIGKALTGGYLTLSAVITTETIAFGISSPNSATGGCMMHGPTFMGNPLACAVANRSLEILKRDNWKAKVDFIEQQLFEQLFVVLDERKDEFWLVQDVRIVGAVAVIEMKESLDLKWFHKTFISEGANVRPFRNLCYIMPPYIISEQELRQLTGTIISVLEKWHALVKQRTGLRDQVKSKLQVALISDG